MQSFSTTSTVGGVQGQVFQDVYVCGADGNIVINDSKKNQLNMARPIKRITVSCGWIVDGISVTYNLRNGETATLEHGSQFGSAATVVDFNPDEVLASVFGHAGRQSYYQREMVNNIGFVIFDTAKGTTRTVGPFGNGNRASEGKPFICSDVIAFGGFAESTPTMGLSGLFFHKDGGKC